MHCNVLYIFILLNFFKYLFLVVIFIPHSQFGILLYSLFNSLFSKWKLLAFMNKFLKKVSQLIIPSNYGLIKTNTKFCYICAFLYFYGSSYYYKIVYVNTEAQVLRQQNINVVCAFSGSNSPIIQHSPFGLVLLGIVCL